MKYVKLMVLIILIFLTSSCSDFFGLSDTNKEDSDKPYNDKVFYSDIMYAIVDTIIDIYNTNLAGKLTGPQDSDVNGPLGGKVHIKGWTGYSSNTGITTVDLSYEMTDCVNISKTKSIEVKLIITGCIYQKGSFKSSGSYKSENYSGTSIKIKGKAKRVGFVERTIDLQGDINIAEVLNSNGGSLSGIICGYETSYTW